MLLIAVFLVFFALVIVYCRCNFVLTRGAAWEAENKAERIAFLVEEITALITGQHIHTICFSLMLAWIVCRAETSRSKSVSNNANISAEMKCDGDANCRHHISKSVSQASVNDILMLLQKYGCMQGGKRKCWQHQIANQGMHLDCSRN